MNATLTDRYVDAAMRTVPEKQRPDLAAELRGSIDDQIEARVDAGETPDAAERAVLESLGDPDALAAGYTDRPLHLIGPRYYLTWWRLLKLLWTIVPVCAAFGVALGQTIAGETVGTIIGTVAAVTVSVIVHVGFWTTLVFFIVERSAKGEDVGFVGAWTIDDLPEGTERRESFVNLIASLVFLVLAAGAIVWDQLVGFVYLEDAGGWMPFLSPALWPWWIGGLFVVMLLEALLAISVYAKGRWDAGSATINAILAAAVAVPAIVLLADGSLVNPEVVSGFAAVIPDDAATVMPIVTIVFSFGIAGIAAWDALDGFLKTRRARGSARR